MRAGCRVSRRKGKEVCQDGQTVIPKEIHMDVCMHI